MSNRKKIKGNTEDEGDKTPEAPRKPRYLGYIDATELFLPRMIIPKDAEISEEGLESQDQPPAEHRPSEPSPNTTP